MTPSRCSRPERSGAWRCVSAVESFRVNPGTSFTLLALLALLVFYRGRARRRLDECSEQIRHARTDGYRHTVHALANTVALAAPWPLALVWVGWLAVSEPWSGRFSVAVGQAAMAAGLALVAFSMLYRAARPEASRAAFPVATHTVPRHSPGAAVVRAGFRGRRAGWSCWRPSSARTR